MQLFQKKTRVLIEVLTKEKSKIQN